MLLFLTSFVFLLPSISCAPVSPTLISSSAGARHNCPEELSPGFGQSNNGPKNIPRLIVYVQHQSYINGEPLSLLPLLEHNTGVTHIIISSFHVNRPPGDITLNDDPPNSTIYDKVWQDVKVVQARGVKVFAMLGGAAAGSYLFLGRANETLFKSYYDPLVTVLRQYGFDGIDLDIEEPIDISVALRLLKSLRKDMGPSFTMTLAPTAMALLYNNGINLSGFSYFDLEGNATDPTSGESLIAWYNTQFYGGWGDPSSPDNYQNIINKGWDPARIVMGVLTNANDGNGFVATRYVMETIKQLKAVYPTFGGVCGWDYFDAGIANVTNEEDGTEPWQWVRKIADALYCMLIEA